MQRAHTGPWWATGAEYLRDVSRLFMTASRSATSLRAKTYCAERAFELAQRAEQLCRERQSGGGVCAHTEACRGPAQ